MLSLAIANKNKNNMIIYRKELLLYIIFKNKKHKQNLNIINKIVYINKCK